MPDRDQVVAHRIDERAAELAVLGRRPQRPAHRVDHAVERLRDAPDLLHAERPDLRVRALEREPLDRGSGQVALRALGEHGHAREHVRPRLEVRQLLAVPPAATVARAHTADAPVGDEQLHRGRSRAGSWRLPSPPRRRGSARAARATRRSCRGSASSAAAGIRSARFGVRK